MGVSSKDKVNLDALIRRQDLEAIKTDNSANMNEGGIPVTELAKGKLYYELLRKPHFQRETDDWNVDNVVTLIKSFRDGNLIPAIILWRSDQGFTFVIDGAHRLSALIAWINDDYGDRNISAQFFMHEIPKKQKEIAEACRQRIAAEVGTYASLSQILTSPNPSSQQIKWASNLTKALMTQWVHGDADIAAASFLAINQRAVQIDPTERYMIEARSQPNVIAARAFVNSTRGHKYWQNFDESTRERIERRARLIYNSIFEPEDADPVKHTRLPPAGLAHTANGLRIALDLVNITNDVKQASLDPDSTGTDTERFINKTYGVVKYVAGGDPASLDLHPAIYFWGATGNHQPSIFLAVISFVQDMILRDELIDFTRHRAKFEEFLVGNSGVVKHILGKHGGWKKSVVPVKKMLRTIFEGLMAGKSDAIIEAELSQPPGQTASSMAAFAVEERRSSWRETKSAARRKASIDMASRCAICKARLDPNVASDDHVIRKEDGGRDSVDNAQLTHHFCNHGFKEYFAHRGEALPDIPTPV
ncbi:HNH endonuclease family protein [Bordetella bronchialis]|uniref:HNH nuclease domain-containing protein n=1 Tax=Bordetella bronchialis TaxID=463025 RepID=A0ABM6CMU5_9BORD|nr:DUF262 domain-containing protein [Bordetella bronchialis]ANN65256.1 hypothetical protein BAU06_02100 [Bordetella bronchialis]